MSLRRWAQHIDQLRYYAIQSGPNPVAYRLPDPVSNPGILPPHEEYRFLPWQDLLSEQSTPGLSLAQSEVEYLGRVDGGTGGVRIRRRWDIDSILIHIDSLAVHRQGFNLSFVMPYLRRIVQDQHITVDGRRQLHTHKHGLLGSGVLTQGARLSTYIVFPYMPLTTDSTQLSRAEQCFWLDEILLPALREVCPSDEIQHCPLSALDAQCQAGAKAERVVKGRHEPIHLQICLSEVRLGPLWESIRRRIDEPIRRARSPSSTPFQPYRDPILFVCGHGVKLLFKADTVAQARTGIGAFLDIGFHSNRLHPDQVWLDLGLEDMPQTPADGEPGKSRFSPPRGVMDSFPDYNLTEMR
jgi:hypothetical protein